MFSLSENLRPSGTSPLHTALSLCRLELKRNGKYLYTIPKNTSFKFY